MLKYDMQRISVRSMRTALGEEPPAQRRAQRELGQSQLHTPLDGQMHTFTTSEVMDVRPRLHSSCLSNVMGKYLEPLSRILM
jgi:hypothetical protein